MNKRSWRRFALGTSIMLAVIVGPGVAAATTKSIEFPSGGLVSSPNPVASFNVRDKTVDVYPTNSLFDLQPHGAFVNPQGFSPAAEPGGAGNPESVTIQEFVESGGAAQAAEVLGFFPGLGVVGLAGRALPGAGETVGANIRDSFMEFIGLAPDLVVPASTVEPEFETDRNALRDAMFPNSPHPPIGRDLDAGIHAGEDRLVLEPQAAINSTDPPWDMEMMFPHSNQQSKIIGSIVPRRKV